MLRKPLIAVVMLIAIVTMASASPLIYPSLR
jgi:hypothetical protein